MASTTTLTSSFGGKATKFYSAAMLEGKTLSTKGITIDSDVQYKYVVRGFDMANLISTGSTCSWDDAGSTTITEGVVEVKPFHINKTECYKDYKANWNDVSADSLPAEIETEVMTKVAGIIQANVDSLLWKGSTTTGTTSGGTYTHSLVDGFIKRLNGNAVEINGVTLSASNIVAQLNRVIDAMPEEIKQLSNDKKVIFVSHKAEGYLKQALAVQAMNTTDKDYAAYHAGIEVRGVNLFDNVIVAGLRESFHVPSNIGLDAATVNFKDMYPVDLTRNARIEAEWQFNAAVSNASQVVLYGF